MSKKGFTVAQVSFPARVNEEMHTALIHAADAAGVPWYEAVKLIAGKLVETCRVAAHAQLVAMRDWSPETWRSERNRFV